MAGILGVIRCPGCFGFVGRCFFPASPATLLSATQPHFGGHAYRQRNSRIQQFSMNFDILRILGLTLILTTIILISNRLTA